ncbi:MAG: primosomal protein N' [Tuberibacillus sp.]
MIAEVIVDLAVNQTDKPFDYTVPESMSEIIEKGSRVVVPFGPRKLLGYVVGFKETSDFKKLRPLESLIDETPALTPELLELGKWLADETLCFQISAFQAMLPAALKADYKKWVRAAQTDALRSEYPELTSIFGDGKTVEWSVLQKKFPNELSRISKAIKKGILETKIQVDDKGSVVTHKVMTPAVPKEELHRYLEKVSRAPKQQAIIRYFLQLPDGEEKAVQEIISELQVGRSAVKALVDKGIFEESDKEVYRDPYHGVAETSASLSLTDEQQTVITPILHDIRHHAHRVHLCHGVTGSGKTEIYLQSIEEVLAKGQEAIVLVPEISLTPQMVTRFKSRFGARVAVLHSGLSRGEKYDEWRKIHRGEVSVVVGARSAIFAPFSNLGIIIIDEEHESSYKQEETPRYHARDVAVFRGQFHRCPVVLGSATPALESYARAQKGVYVLSTLKERVNKQAMPVAEIVDMREELRSGNHSMFSGVLLDKLRERLDANQQSVLFLNRRGYSTFVLCRDCGNVLQCPHCDISLTYHRNSQQMKCHYCGYDERVPDACPKCNSPYIRFFGSGTQKVEEALTKLLPEARIIRMDVDTTQRKGSHEKLLKTFGEGKADILLGTQMIAKGLDFPKVTLVGVLAADTSLRLPDFRAAEKTFQLLTQVSGRAGRHELKGEVIIQTYAPEHYSITLAATHDYLSFYEREMMDRKRHAYPPFYYITLINVTHESFARAQAVTDEVARYLKKRLSNQAVILGPVAPTIAKVKDRYRSQCMIKYKNEPELKKALKTIVDHYQKAYSKEGLTLSVDVNPSAIM